MPATEILRRDFGEVLYVSPAVPARGARAGERPADEPLAGRRWHRLGYPRDVVLDDRLRRLGVGR
jgi:hypothetical protein